MDKIRIRGGQKLQGEISISGAKNAALPLMAASLLSEQPLVLSNIPLLADIKSMIRLLQHLGVRSEITEALHSNSRTLTLQAEKMVSDDAPYDFVRKMRASILVLGPLLARNHEANVSLPGGCAIGTRPVDLHIRALEKMGAKIDIENGYIHAKAPDGLKGADISFPKVTVTGTENILMAACLAKGRTRLFNSATEPEVCDLAHCLVAMGAQITGIGTSILTVDGVDSLTGTRHQVIADRIETGTYILGVAICGGRLRLNNTSLDILPTFKDIVQRLGVHVTQDKQDLIITRSGKLNPVKVQTDPYPGYPTDLQAQLMAVLCITPGISFMKETIFENRYMHVPELNRMGANITVTGNEAHIEGVDSLEGAEVMATDLRASVSLVLAGLVAKGDTVINRVYHLDRGYEGLVDKLKKCGALIERISEAELSLASS